MNNAIATRDFLARQATGIPMELALALDRLGTRGIRVKAIALREDIWPALREYHGLPVVRLTSTSPVKFGVLS